MTTIELQRRSGGEKTATSAVLIIGSCMENSSAHGISNIKRAHQNIRRLFWICAFLTSFSVCVWQITLLISAYLDRQVTTNVDVITKTKLTFPAVTICNNNGMLKSYLQQNEELFNDINGTATKLDSKFQYWDNDDDESYEAPFDLINLLTEHLSPIAYDDRESSGHQINTSLLSCIFNGIPCNPNHFSYVYNYLFGNCYTYNNGMKFRASSTVSAGPIYGLTLEMNIQQSEYIADIRPAAGLRILVHDQHEMPFPEDKGINVPPARETSVGVYRTEFERLPHPYPSNCKLKESPTIFSRRFPGIEYSKSACLKDCLYRHTFLECDCYNSRYTYDSESPVCKVGVEEEEECLLNTETMIAEGNISCNCGPACTEVSYSTSVFSSAWPGSEYLPKIVDKLLNTPAISVEGNDTEKFIYENFAKLNVYYENLQYDSIEQVATYTLLSLVSNVGGHLGLWIGMSALTLMEFLECMYDVLYVLMFRRKNATQNVSQSANGAENHSSATFKNDAFSQ
ncbi:acid-sensing ion channel 1A-like [Antedon mediterranea]|uniref:acid-sensing ion channel 1A-like n=1 Tax=Antedon mediterranea TaxID=105859 RepID=UPI003AF47FDC